MDDEMFRRLEEMDAALRELEMDGRLLEERIRSGLWRTFITAAAAAAATTT